MKRTVDVADVVMSQEDLAEFVSDVDGSAGGVLYTTNIIINSRFPYASTENSMHQIPAKEGKETYPGHIVVLVHNPDSPGMRVGDRWDEHIALEDFKRRGRDKREQGCESRKDTEEEKVRKGVRELHDDCVMRSAWMRDVSIVRKRLLALALVVVREMFCDVRDGTR